MNLQSIDYNDSACLSYLMTDCCPMCSGIVTGVVSDSIIYISLLFFRVHLASSKWSLKRKVVYIHGGEPSRVDVISIPP
jgi:hypothetical protein